MGRINVWIPDALLERLDEEVHVQRKTRSKFISEAVKSSLDHSFLEKEIVKMAGAPKIINTPKKAQEAVTASNLCKHNSMIGLCKFGCTK